MSGLFVATMDTDRMELWLTEEKADDSTLTERMEMGRALLECSLEVKRILSPILSYSFIQARLVSLHRFVNHRGCYPSVDLCATRNHADLTEVLSDQRGDYNATLEEMRSTDEKVRRQLNQRHEEWIDIVRDQV